MFFEILHNGLPGEKDRDSRVVAALPPDQSLLVKVGQGEQRPIMAEGLTGFSRKSRPVAVSRGNFLPGRTVAPAQNVAGVAPFFR
jgi:hypothetical protein